MNVTDRTVHYMNGYDGCPDKELIARAHIAAMERKRREREEKAKLLVLELEKTLQHQPNGFAD